MSFTSVALFIPWGFFYVSIILIAATKAYPQSADFVSKKGGVCFRVDDNHPITRFNEFAAVFKKYNKHFCFSINLVYSFNSTYADGIRDLQSRGHEMMDHTPLHGTGSFSTILPIDYYINHPGVQEISSSAQVLLKYASVNMAEADRSGYADFNDDTLKCKNGEFGVLKQEDCFFYFPSLGQLVIINPVYGWLNENTIEVSDPWFRSIHLGTYKNIKYYNFHFTNIHLTIDAVRALIGESVRLADYYNLERPKTWIQPGSFGPQLHRQEIKQAGAEFGYTSAATNNPSLKTFNEYNPDGDKQYGMNWGDINGETYDLAYCKYIIAERVAKHYVLIVSSHFQPADGWEAYLNRTDQLLQWCTANDIPVRTYSEWADILYNQISDPSENIFPRLDVDLDGNNIPDGYIGGLKGTLRKNDPVPGSNDYCYSINSAGQICSISGLGGIEKGRNEFEIWTKGTAGNFIEVNFKAGAQSIIYKFPAENSSWTKYNLDQSVNGNTTLTIPDNISVIDITINCTNYSSGEVKIGGMSLKKYGLFPVELSSFTASAVKNMIKLQWKTKTEVNNYGFEIERASSSIVENPTCSAENGKFEKIGFVKGNGNSNSPKNYSFVDINPSPGSKFIYRLKQIDTNGDFEYSNEAPAELSADRFILHRNYPNPFNPETAIKFELPERSFVKLVIYDLLGKEIMKLEDAELEPGYYEKKWKAVNSAGTPVSNGIYICRFYARGVSGIEHNKTIKMLLIK